MMSQADISSLAAKVVARLADLGRSVATAESCTGGLIAAALTEVPGASRVFRYGWVTYCNEAKMQELDVPAHVIEQHTVVSKEVVCAMASTARAKACADYALAVSGNAGPTAAAGEPPVGTVCIALATGEETLSSTIFHPGLNRHDFRQMVLCKALQLLLNRL